MKRIKNKSGFTLAEVLVAILLIALATTALVASISSASKINAAAIEKDAEFQENLKLVQRHEETLSFSGIMYFGDGKESPVKYYTGVYDSENLVVVGKG